jgi:hypothetical protein
VVRVVLFAVGVTGFLEWMHMNNPYIGIVWLSKSILAFEKVQDCGTVESRLVPGVVILVDD